MISFPKIRLPRFAIIPSTAMSIPLIDLSSADQTATHQAWDSAFRRYGCCILTGHGIVDEDFAKMKADATSFFATSLEHKLKFNYGPYGNDKGGYTPRSGEAVAQSNTISNKESPPPAGKVVAADPVESFIINPETRQRHIDILPSSETYFCKCEELIHRLHVISTRALGIPEDVEVDFFRKFYCASDEHAVGNGVTSLTLRLAHYPPQEQADCEEGDSREENEARGARYGAHTDYMGFTVLKPDEGDWSDTVEGARGLEVFDSIDNSWIPVCIPDDIKKTAVVVNAGDLLQRWTNDRWTSPIHRVTSPDKRSAAAKLSRTALVFFSGPMCDALITTCPACTDLNSPEKYDPVLAMDYLMSKINPTVQTFSSGKSL